MLSQPQQLNLAFLNKIIRHLMVMLRICSDMGEGFPQGGHSYPVFAMEIAMELI